MDINPSTTWVWYQFQHNMERKRTSHNAIQIQTIVRKRLANKYTNIVRMKSIKNLTRYEFELYLSEIVSLSKDQLLKTKNIQEQEEITKYALKEVLWESRRLCRDIASMWWSQARDVQKVEKVLVKKTKRARRTSMVAASMLEGVSMRATQLLEHLQAAKKNGGKGESVNDEDGNRDDPNSSSSSSSSSSNRKEEDDHVTKLRKKRHKKQSKKRIQKNALHGSSGGGDDDAKMELAEDELIQMSLKLGQVVDQQLNDTLIQVQKDSRVVSLVDISTQTKISGKIKRHRGSTNHPVHKGHHQHHHHHQDNKNKHAVTKKHANPLSHLLKKKKVKNEKDDEDDGDDAGEEEATETTTTPNKLAMFAGVFSGKNTNTTNKGGSASFMGMLRAMSKFRKKMKTKLPPERSTMSMILDIYLSKIAIDQQSDRDQVPRIDFGKYCYQFFYRRYGLRKLAEQHLIGMNAAFSKYSKNARIKLFARCCGCYGGLDKDCLDFMLYLIGTIQQRDADALDALDDGSCWMSETRAVNLIRIAADTIAHSGPMITNRLEPTEKEKKESKKSKSTSKSKEGGEAAAAAMGDEDDEFVSPADYEVLLENMLRSVSKEAIPAHNIVENVANALGGGGGSARKVIGCFRTRPDFAQGIRHLVPLLKKLDQESVDELLSLKCNNFQTKNQAGNNKDQQNGEEQQQRPSKLIIDGIHDKSPIQLYVEYQESKKAKAKNNNASPPPSPKRGARKASSPSTPSSSSPSKNQKTPNSKSNMNTEDAFLDELSAAWIMSDSQEHFLHGRDSYGISLDAVLVICINSLLSVRAHILQRAKVIFHHFEVAQHAKGKDQEINGRIELNAWDFCMLLWEIDPTISEGKGRQLFELCVTLTEKEHFNYVQKRQNTSLSQKQEDSDGSDNDQDEMGELDEISMKAFLQICKEHGLFRGWCQTFGKRKHTTGGQKLAMVEHRKMLIQNVDLLKTLNPRQVHSIVHAFIPQIFEPKTMICTQGDQGDSFFIIEEGEIDVWIKKEKKKQFISTLEKGSFFGEKALLTNEPRNADCIAKTQVTCLVLSKKNFDHALGPLQEILEQKAKEFSFMHENWINLHQPVVQEWLKTKQRELKSRQQEYMHAEKEIKGHILSFIEPLTEAVSDVKSTKKTLEKLLKGRSEIEEARKSITKLLMLVDEEKKGDGMDDDLFDEEEEMSMMNVQEVVE